MNTYYYMVYDVSIKTIWWALSNTSLIMWIHLAVYEISANKAFTVTDDLISQLFVVTFVHPTYVQIALIWGFLTQLILWKFVYWLLIYKLNKFCNIATISTFSRCSYNNKCYLQILLYILVRNIPVTEPVILKVYNIKLSFDI